MNISNRPPNVAEFIIWCHLDGSIKNSPAKGVKAIIGRVVADIIKAPKQIDALIIRDALCGTAARACPKYHDGEYPIIGPAPDIFLFPSAAPVFGQDEHPPVHTEQSCLFPFRVLDLYAVPANERDVHIHTVDIRLSYDHGQTNREVVVRQGGVEQFRNSAPVKVR